MVKTFYIMRHGETFATKRNAGYGALILMASILKDGIPAVERQADYLKGINTDGQFSSRIKRCRQTAKIVTEITGKKFIFDGRINEYWLETNGHFKRRIKSFLDDLDANGYESVLILTHGAGIAAITHLLTTGVFGIAEIIDYPKPGVLTIIERGKSARRIDFNVEQSS